MTYGRCFLRKKFIKPPIFFIVITSCFVGVLFVLSGNQEEYEFLISPEEKVNIGRSAKISLAIFGDNSSKSILKYRIFITILYCVSFIGNVNGRRKNMLDGCRFVYLDVGTNIGVQIRKLFEPKLYPRAKIHKIFNYFFGNLTERTNAGVCAVGFEPNPSHSLHLQGTLGKKWVQLHSS